MNEYNISNIMIKNKIFLAEDEKKIFGIFLALINKDSPSDDVEFLINTLNQMLNLEDADILKILKSLSEKTLEISDSDDEYIVSPFIYIKFNKEKRIITFKFNNSINGLFEKLMSIHLATSSFKENSLKGKYFWTIYELLSKINDGQEHYISIDYLRKILRLDTQYKLYGDFKRKVLLYSQKEINEKTDINFSFREEKSNKKTIGLWITVEPKKEPRD